MNNKLWAIVLGSAVLLGQAWGAGNPDAGKAKFYTCRGCHGISGYTNAYPNYHVPKIGGQYEPYLIGALQAYKEGARTHGSMQGNAGAMSEQDMADLAAYLVKFESKTQEGPVTGDVARGQELAAKCASCHGTDGNAPAPNFPRLAGQYESYLVKAIEDYQSGKRQNPIMQSMVQGLTAKDIRGIAAYYASQVGLGIIGGD